MWRGGNTKCSNSKLLWRSGIIRENRITHSRKIPSGALELGFVYSQLAWHVGCSPMGKEIEVMATLTSRLFWDKKIRIAILTFATFLAMC